MMQATLHRPETVRTYERKLDGEKYFIIKVEAENGNEQVALFGDEEFLESLRDAVKPENISKGD